MNTKIIRIGTSLGLIIPSSIAKDFNFQTGTQIEISNKLKKEIVIKKIKEVRQGWSQAFSNYAIEGQDEMYLPEYIDGELDALI